MRVSKHNNRTYIYFKLFSLEVLRSHINYRWEWRGEYYHMSIPFNPFYKAKYGFYISEDGTPSNARYYRPKREWGLVEPNDPGYITLIEAKQKGKS